MIKKLFYFIIPLFLFSFSQNVSALTYTDFNYSTYSKSTSPNEYYLEDYQQNSTLYQFITSNDNSSLFYDKVNKELIITSSTNKTVVPFINNLYTIKYFTFYKYSDYYSFTFSSTEDIPFNNLYLNKTYKRPYQNTFYHPYFICSLSTKSTGCSTMGTASRQAIMLFGISNFTSLNDFLPNLYSNFKLYDTTNNLLNVNYFNLDQALPKLSYTLEPIYKDGYLSSYGIKVDSTLVNDNKYKYQYAIKDNINDNLVWNDLYNNNFINNQFSYITKKPIYFYFRILDKSNNEIIDSFNITISFNLVSSEYDIIFNQTKFYLNGTNYIDRVGLSITYKTSVDGLKYQYQYVNDGSSLNENNWIDTDTDIYKVYSENGTLYARILDNNNNNILYSNSFTNTLIGTQDILENPGNFPLYNKVQSVLNFNSGSISDLVLVPVRVLMFITDSLNNNVCSEYSFGSLLGHELKLPCIDIKSYVGETIYNFYDLVCSFFISLGIIRLLKNIYMRFMTLDIRDIDRNGGIF